MVSGEPGPSSTDDCFGVRLRAGLRSTVVLDVLLLPRMSRIVKDEKDCFVDVWLAGEFCASVCVISNLLRVVSCELELQSTS